jgi:hypothetical protein
MRTLPHLTVASSCRRVTHSSPRSRVRNDRHCTWTLMWHHKEMFSLVSCGDAKCPSVDPARPIRASEKVWRSCCNDVRGFPISCDYLSVCVSAVPRWRGAWRHHQDDHSEVDASHYWRQLNVPYLSFSGDSGVPVLIVHDIIRCLLSGGNVLMSYK